MYRGINGCGNSLDMYCLDRQRISESQYDSGRRVVLMNREVLPIFIAVVVSAVVQVDLIRTFAVIEITYKLIQLSLWFLCKLCKDSKQEKCPSNSAKLNGRRRNRRY